MANTRAKAPCFDCGIDTLASGGDWYSVHNHLWKVVWPNTKQATGRIEKPLSEILCIRCLELRLGRALTPGDFTTAPINETILTRLFGR
jgi:hypothetical protein